MYYLLNTEKKTGLLVKKSYYFEFISLFFFGLFHQLWDTIYFALIAGLFMGSSREASDELSYESCIMPELKNNAKNEC